MPELFRTRDCVVLQKGRTTTVSITDAMAVSGWKGAQGVAWAASTTDGFLVDLSAGEVAGFCLWGSDEVPDEFTAMTRNQPAYKFVVIGFSGWIIMTPTYEQYTLFSRTHPGPLVSIVYTENDPLYFSLRGYWTNEKEDPLDEKTGFVAQIPSSSRNGYMTIQVAL
jgi:hypothetical protein